MIEYRTIKENGEHEIVIKKSRFICHLERVQNQEEADAFVARIKKENYKAAHNCVAYQIGDHNEIQRALDDGEPSGTAGVPMLEVLKQKDLQYVAVVVTRYFGGIKLGASGLIRAYSNSVSEGVDAVGIVKRELQTKLSVIVDYAMTGQMDYWISESPYTLLNTTYMADVTYDLGVPTGEIEDCEEAIENLTSGNVLFDVGEETYVDIPVDQ